MSHVPELTWTGTGHPELEGEPTLSTVNGPIKVPPKPPQPGGRDVDGYVSPLLWKGPPA